MDAVTRESRARIAGKYDKNLENSLRSWITQRTGKNIGGDFMGGLRDGVILCELANVRKINKPGMAFKEMENLETFNKACRKLGLNDVDLFVTNDLYNNANPTQVLQNLDALRKKLGGGGGGGGGGGLGAGYSGKQHHVRTNSSNRVFNSKPAQITPRGAGGSFGLRNKFEGKQQQQTPPPFNGGGHAAPRSPANKFGGGGHAAPRSPANKFGGGGGAGPKFCGECGANSAGKKFCAECGVKLF